MNTTFAALAEGVRFHFNGYCWLKYGFRQAICAELVGIYSFELTDFVVPV